MVHEDPLKTSDTQKTSGEPPKTDGRWRPTQKQCYLNNGAQGSTQNQQYTKIQSQLIVHKIWIKTNRTHRSNQN